MHMTMRQPSAGYAQTEVNPCSPNGHTCFPFGVLERPRYFPRQLITPDELGLEAEYFRDRLRRHNIYLHGWGVVCGALVCVIPETGQKRTDTTRSRGSLARAAATNGGNGNVADTASGTVPWKVRVEPGYILGPYGDEIIIDCAQEVSLRGGGVSGCAGAGDDLSDPWCSEVYDSRISSPLWVAVRYKECRVRPVRAQPAGCGCDDTPCEHSRFRDSYEIDTLDCCPPGHETEQPEGLTLRGVRNPACPDCPQSPWVVLARVEFDANGTVTLIDNCDCRRIVPSLRGFEYACQATECDQPARDGTMDSRRGERELFREHQHGTPQPAPETPMSETTAREEARASETAPAAAPDLATGRRSSRRTNTAGRSASS